MYRVITEQRGARRRRAAVAEDAGWAIDVDAVRRRPRRWPRRLAVQPEQPDRAGRTRRGDRRPARRHRQPTPPQRRPPATVVLDEAYAEFVGSSLLPLRLEHPNLIVVRTASKAYALAGLRVGFAVARPETIARIAPYRPPGSIATVSVTIVTEALREPSAMRENLARVERERERLSAGLSRGRLAGRPVGDELPARRFDDPACAAMAAESLLRSGLVPRTFGAGHPLADRSASPSATAMRTTA